MDYAAWMKGQFKIYRGYPSANTFSREKINRAELEVPCEKNNFRRPLRRHLFKRNTFTKVFHHLFPISSDNNIRILAKIEPSFRVLLRMPAAQDDKRILRHEKNFPMHEIALSFPIDRKTGHVCFGSQKIKGAFRLETEIDDIQCFRLRLDDLCDTFKTDRWYTSKFI